MIMGVSMVVTPTDGWGCHIYTPFTSLLCEMERNRSMRCYPTRPGAVFSERGVDFLRGSSGPCKRFDWKHTIRCQRDRERSRGNVVREKRWRMCCATKKWQRIAASWCFVGPTVLKRHSFLIATLESCASGEAVWSVAPLSRVLSYASPPHRHFCKRKNTNIREIYTDSILRSTYIYCIRRGH